MSENGKERFNFKNTLEEIGKLAEEKLSPNDSERSPSKFQKRGLEEAGEEKEKSYFNEATINGFNFCVGWIGRCYMIEFPQIELVKGYGKGVPAKSIEIGKDPEIAEQVFTYASKQAPYAEDVYDLYKKVRDFARKI